MTTRMDGDEKKGVWVVDLSIAPEIYKTDNPAHFEKFCIDFQPETVPTIASFHTEQQAHDHLKEKFPQEHKRWFPYLYEGVEYSTCIGCLCYTRVDEQVQTFCPACLLFIRSLTSVEEEPEPETRSTPGAPRGKSYPKTYHSKAGHGRMRGPRRR